MAFRGLLLLSWRARALVGVQLWGYQAVPREVLILREIMAIPDNTQKYIRYLELTSRPRSADIAFTIPRRRW